MIGLHRLNPIANATSGADHSRSAARHGSGSGSNNSQREHRQLMDNNNIIRISAKTAPQVVSSVPKCRNTKTSRSHPMDTINGAAINLDYVSDQGGNNLMSDQHRSAQLHQQRQQLHGRHHQHLTAARDDEQQMVLIVNDDNQGAPIIGRRLPSKSMGGNLASWSSRPLDNYHTQPPDLAEPSMGGAHRRLTNYPPVASAPTGGPLVVGRRPNRLIQQQQCQIYDYEAAGASKYSQLEGVVDPSLLMRPSSGSRRSLTHQDVYQELQPLSIIETTHTMASQQQVARHLKPLKTPASASKPKAKLAGPRSGSNTGRRQVRQGGIVTSSHPPSCPLGCPCGAQSPHPYSPADLGSHHMQPESTCDEECHCYNSSQVVPQSYQADGCHMRRSASCQRVVAPCCTNTVVPPTGLAKRAPYPVASPSHEYRSHMDLPENSYKELPQEDRMQQHRHDSGSQRQPRSSISSHRHHQQQEHHSTCQANNGPQAGSRRPPASYRSSSCHDHRPRQPMLISGRNLLPVHPKPTLINYSIESDRMPSKESVAAAMASHSRLAAANCAEISRVRGAGPTFYQSPNLLAANEVPDTGVSQMYESLAAELKAKLGDPKMGPILLPPKDYDTMSRKQGKLTGIELRRSTNPMLVGPTANRLPSATSCTLINEEPVDAPCNPADRKSGHKKLPSTNNGDTSSPVCGSSRSSGRSQDDRSLQRSRSNSSSGLGSISMGAGSPNSSPSSKSSSSEDMRQASNGTTIHHNDSLSNNLLLNASNFTSKITIDSMHRQTNGEQKSVSASNKKQMSNDASVASRKHSSPDYCGASDSGHSESGPLEERNKFRASGSGDIYSKFNDPNHKANSKQDSAKLKQQDKLTSSGQLHSNNNPAAVSSSGVLWNGRVEVPLKVNSNKNNGNTYLATKQIIY